MSIEELVGTLKVYEQQLQQDERIKKGKSLALSAQKTKKSSTSKDFSSRSMSKKAFNAYTSSDNASNKQELNEDDQLAFISKMIRKMWRKRANPTGRARPRVI